MYMLFAGDNYYPCGGMDDFQGIFADKDSAIEWLKEKDSFDWAHLGTLGGESIFLNWKDSSYG